MSMLKCALIVLVCLVGSASAAETGTTPGNHLVVPEHRFRDMFNDYLYRHLEKEKADVMVSRFKVLNNTPVPDGEASFKLFQKNSGTLRGLVRLAAVVQVDGIPENEVKLSGWVDIFSPVVCASRNLRKGDVLRDDDVVVERKNISRLPADTLDEKGQAVGLLVKHSIRQGTSLKEWMLEKPPILLKGDLVTILAEKGSIRITVPGMILEKGYQGELIRVKNAMSSKEIYARVRNNTTVTVDF